MVHPQIYLHGKILTILTTLVTGNLNQNELILKIINKI